MAGLTGLAAFLYGPPTHRFLSKVGTFRELSSTPLSNPDDLVVLGDTIHCEDVHYYAPAHTLFTACEDVSTTRFQWFPPLATFADASVAWKSKGSIHIIDPETRENKRLAFENFDGPFITHGIDVIPDPEKPTGEAVYIFAVNHVPNEAVYPRDGSTPTSDPGTAPKAASRIEVFHHTIGGGTAKHIRTIAHPLIKTPNDVYAVSPTEFYVSNDHYYYDGYMRHIEDSFPGAKWSDVIRASVSADGKVEASVALDKRWNPNGMGHGRTPDEILVTSAVGGVMWVGRLGSSDAKIIDVAETIDLDVTTDNPSYYSDPFSSADHDASGFVLPGLTRAINLSKTGHLPGGREGSSAWLVTPSKNTTGEWDNRKLWEDDGGIVRNAATAVLVGIDPKKEGGKKHAWLYVTGFSSENMAAVKVDLS